MPATAASGTLARSVLADQVKERLLEEILAGRYAPDARIVETQVARELGTSQAPVREALRGLEAIGVVEIADNGTLGKVWRSLEPFSRTYITLVVPGADPQWSADLHTPILQALLARDTDAVVAALERHFADVAANMARRLPDRTEDETPA